MNESKLPSGDLEFRRWTRIRSVVMECLRKSDTPGGYERHSAFAEATANEIMERLSSLELETEQPKDAPQSPLDDKTLREIVAASWCKFIEEWRRTTPGYMADDVAEFFVRKHRTVAWQIAEQASDDLREKLKDWADRPRFFGDRYVREGYDIAVDDVRRILNDEIPQIQFGDMPP